MKTDVTTHAVARHFIQYGLIDQTIAVDALIKSQASNISFITHLVKNNILTSTEIATSFAETFNLTKVNLDEQQIIFDQSLLSNRLIQEFRVIPIKRLENNLQLGMSDPTNQQAIEAVTFHSGLNVIPVIVQEDQLTHLLDIHFNQQEINKAHQLNLLKKITVTDDTQHKENLLQQDEPLIQFVDQIIQHAFEQTASDIHIEPYETLCRIRYRQHGVLYTLHEIPLSLASRIAMRLKVLARLDITERRLPQDGRFQLNQIDIRINTCPTLFGEKIVLRLLNSIHKQFNLDDIGLSNHQKESLLKILSKPQGMILVAGPTGSGKTVTLYSALKHLNHSERNISTVEDPVEIRLSGINQVNINPKIGLDFSTALRTFLRQDPDVIMVGEIRDTETANIAIQAAQTGHFVLSTLHTNSAIETITRLQSMNVLAYNFANSISLIIAQRLIRKLCEHCKQPDDLPKSFLLLNQNKKIKPSIIYRAGNCSQCHYGYTGRTAIYEFLTITDDLSKLIVSGAPTHTLLSQAKHDGFTTLQDVIFKKVNQGITSFSEANRVLNL